jgi:hypothetical protein
LFANHFGRNPRQGQAFLSIVLEMAKILSSRPEEEEVTALSMLSIASSVVIAGLRRRPHSADAMQLEHLIYELKRVFARVGVDLTDDSVRVTQNRNRLRRSGADE